MNWISSIIIGTDHCCIQWYLTDYVRLPIRQNSGDLTPRSRPHPSTLNIPGMTQSKVSPDGKIPKRDVGAKLVVIMVGLPARGKSYITKKIHRYLSWQQHDTQIFNVGNRRRVAASAIPTTSPRSPKLTRASSGAAVMDPPTQAAHMILTGWVPSISFCWNAPW